MRTLSPALITELGLTTTRPGYLIEIQFSSISRLSTLGDISFSGYTWVGADVRVSGLSRSDSGSQMGNGGTLSISNTDLVYGALVLNQGVADRIIRVYSVWAGAPTDAVLEFEGIGDSAELVGTRVAIKLIQDSNRYVYSPRRFISPESGFNTLLPTGTKISIGGQTMILERA
jgi:hypothetical protein